MNYGVSKNSPLATLGVRKEHVQEHYDSSSDEDDDDETYEAPGSDN